MILQHRLKATSERPEIEVIKDYSTLPLVECYAGQLNQVFILLVSVVAATKEVAVAKVLIFALFFAPLHLCVSFSHYIQQRQNYLCERSNVDFYLT
jgi:hypothetical protein